MPKRIPILFLICITFLNFKGNAQPVDPNDVKYDRELCFGINMNSKAGLIGGIDIKYIKKRNPTTWTGINLEIVNVKHSKEIQVSSVNGSAFQLGKIAYLFSFRPQFVFEKQLFKKDFQDGIRTNFVLGIGPTFGLVKPYYIEYLRTKKVSFVEDGIVKDSNYTYSSYEAYDPQIHSTSFIAGSGGFFKGFNQTKLVMGINTKIGLNFEFSLFDEKITGLEVGYSFEAFTKNLRLHEVNERQQYFHAIYLVILFGNRYPAKNTSDLNGVTPYR